MSLAIALIAIFAVSQFLVFGVLLAFAIQFVRVKDATHKLSDEVDDLWEAHESIREYAEANDQWKERTNSWAEGVTELQGRIVEVLKGDI